MLVTPTSELIFRVLDRSSFLKDSTLGERVVYLGQILEHYNGRCDNLELNMDLLGPLKPEGRSKSGELVVVLNGLKIDNMSAYHHANGVSNGLGASSAGGTNAMASDAAAAGATGRSSILSGGIRARMRLRSTPSNSSTASNQSGSGGDTTFFGPNTLNDLRSARLHSDPQMQHGNGNRAPNMISTVACTPNINRNSGLNWDASQSMISCNGVASNQRALMVRGK